MKDVLGGQLSHDYYPPTDGCFEMVIKSHGPSLSLKILLRCLVNENLWTWGSVPSTIVFAYIDSVNRIMGMILLEIVTFSRLRVPIDFLSMFAFHCPFEYASVSALALHFHSSHQEIRYKIVMSNEGYKQSANLHCSHCDF